MCMVMHQLRLQFADSLFSEVGLEAQILDVSDMAMRSFLNQQPCAVTKFVHGCYEYRTDFPDWLHAAP